jgi:hypothetical protein
MNAESMNDDHLGVVSLRRPRSFPVFVIVLVIQDHRADDGVANYSNKEFTSADGAV